VVRAGGVDVAEGVEQVPAGAKLAAVAVAAGAQGEGSAEWGAAFAGPAATGAVAEGVEPAHKQVTGCNADHDQEEEGCGLDLVSSGSGVRVHQMPPRAGFQGWKGAAATRYWGV